MCSGVGESEDCLYWYSSWLPDVEKEASKLSLAAEMVRIVMEVLGAEHQVVILADSWYGKSEIFMLGEQFDNLNVICNVRKDTMLYDLAPPRTGKKE